MSSTLNASEPAQMALSARRWVKPRRRLLLAVCFEQLLPTDAALAVYELKLLRATPLTVYSAKAVHKLICANVFPAKVSDVTISTTND